MEKYLGKSWRTTLIGIFGALLVVSCLLLVFLEKATLSEAATFGGGLSALLLTISSFLNKDAKASHSKELQKKIDELEKKIK